MASTGSLARLLDPGFRHVFYDYLEKHPMEYSRIFNVETSERAYEEDIVYAGLGPVPEKPEGTNVLYDDIIQGNIVRFTHITYASGWRVTEEMADDDLYGVTRRVVLALARSAKHTIETIAWDTINLAFDATRVGQDNMPLCSTAHPLLGGGTASNMPATPLDLTAANLQSALDNFERQKDHRQLPVAISARHLLVPPELKWKARELLQSTKKPETAQNDPNALLEEDLSYFTSHYLTSTSAWFVHANKDEHDLRIYIRRPIRMRSSDDFDSGDMKSKVDFRCSAGFMNFWGFWGSQGA